MTELVEVDDGVARAGELGSRDDEADRCVSRITLDAGLELCTDDTAHAAAHVGDAQSTLVGLTLHVRDRLPLTEHLVCGSIERVGDLNGKWPPRHHQTVQHVTPPVLTAFGCTGSETTEKGPFCQDNVPPLKVLP